MGFIGIYISLLSLLFYFFIYIRCDAGSHKKVIYIYSIVVAIYTSVTYFLSEGWYSSNAVAFHWFDDGGEWLLMDKVGHFFTAAAWSRFAVLLFIYCGVDKVLAHRRIVWLGFLLLSAVEWFDGISPLYGASFYDILANFLGSLFIYIQYRYFGSIKLFSKWGYWPDSLAALRPNMLGANAGEQILKNYNGHIFWFSTPINAFFKSKYIPSWLCLSVGYGVQGVLGGDDNIYTDSVGVPHNRSDITRYSQIYISFDVMVTPKESHKRWQKVIIYVMSVLKFPCPAIEFSTYNGIVFHWIAV